MMPYHTANARRGAIIVTTPNAYLPPDIPVERVVACLGLVSDTHMPERWAALPPALFAVLHGVDLLLHAGDVGELWVLDRLSTIAPVVVHGNDDTEEAQRELPYQQIIAVAGQRILLCHCHYLAHAQEMDSRRDDAWTPKLDRRAALGQRAGAAVVVFGHTHIPMTRRHQGVLLVNPGAIASSSAFTRQRVQTVALLFLRDDAYPCVVHVDLASPEHAFVPRIDWDAGYSTALDMYSASIVSPSHIDNPRYLREAEAALARRQRKLQTKKRGSKNRRRAKGLVAKAHRRIRNKRLDFHHQQARKIVARHGAIAIEGLRIKNMVRNPHLAKSIADAGWNQFLTILTTKAEEAGLVVVVVNPAGTSQVCSGCGRSVPKTLSDRWHTCPYEDCGLSLQRDHNSARELLDRAGLADPLRGYPVAVAPAAESQVL
jgi:IS605 OrfB family transposase